MLGDDPAAFRPSDPLTRGELHAALVAIGKHPAPPLDPAKPVTIRELDAQLVAALGLVPAARRFRLAARDAGLAPSAMLGTETVARLLGLRLNHPQADEALELLPSQPATRAEAAYSFARRARSSCPTGRRCVEERVQAFAIPALIGLAAHDPDPRVAVRRVSVRVRRGVGEDAAAVEPDCAERIRHRSWRIRLLRARLAGLQDPAVRGARRCSARA